MSATVTLNSILKIVDQLAEEDREKLFRKIREKRRKLWLKKLEADAEQALKDHRAGKLKSLSSPEDIRAFMGNLNHSDEA